MPPPEVVNAATVTEQDVTVTTPDGTGLLLRPIICWHVPAIDAAYIFGLRLHSARWVKRLAESGYPALVANPFYRN